MNLRNTLILFLAFVALAVFAWTLREREGKQFGNSGPEPTPAPMWDFEAADVTEVVVSRGSDEYTLSREGDAWLVDGEATNDEVSGLVDRIAEPTILRVLPEDRDPDVYGFDTPALTITLSTADGDTILHRGDKVPTSSDYYIRSADGGAIRIFSGFDIDSMEEWLDEPPLVPTATPEPVEVDAIGDEEGLGDGAAEGDAYPGGEDEVEGDEASGEDADADTEGDTDGESESDADGSEEDDDESTGEEDSAETTATPTAEPTPEPTPDDGEGD